MLNKERSNVMQAVSAAEEQLSAQRTETYRLLSKKLAPVAGTQTAGAGKSPAVLAQEYLSKYPEVSPILKEYFKGFVSRRYFRFYSKVGFDEVAIAKFENLMTSGMSMRLPVGSGQGTLPLTIAATGDEINIDESIRREFGDAVLQEFQFFKRTPDLEVTLTKIATDLVQMGAPLSQAEGDELAQLLLRNSPEYLAGGTFARPGVDWGPVLQEAQNRFSVIQQNALRRAATEAKYQSAVTTATQIANRRPKL